MQCAITALRDKADKTCNFNGFRQVFEVTPLTRNHPRGIVKDELALAAGQYAAARRMKAMSVECSIWGR